MKFRSFGKLSFLPVLVFLGLAFYPLFGYESDTNSLTGIIHFTDQGKPAGTIYVPPSYDGKKPYSLLVLLHGRGGSGRSMVQTENMIPQADQNEVILLGLDSENAWSSMPDSQDLPTILSMTRLIRDRYNILSGSTFILGFSAGAAFMPYVVVNNPRESDGKRLFNRFVMASGELFLVDLYLERKLFTDELKTPIYMCWGDRELPGEPGLEQGKKLQAMGWNITFHNHSDAHTIPASEVPLIYSWLKLPSDSN